MTEELREDEESGEFGGVVEKGNGAVDPWLSPGATWAESGRKAGWGNFHGQRPGHIAFTFTVVVEQVCWEAKGHNWELSRISQWWSGTSTEE